VYSCAVCQTMQVFFLVRVMKFACGLPGVPGPCGAVRKLLSQDLRRSGAERGCCFLLALIVMQDAAEQGVRKGARVSLLQQEFIVMEARSQSAGSPPGRAESVLSRRLQLNATSVLIRIAFCYPYPHHPASLISGGMVVVDCLVEAV